MPKDASDTNRLPDDELFDNPVGRTLPCAPLPTIETPFGQSLYPVLQTRVQVAAVMGFARTGGRQDQGGKISSLWDYVWVTPANQRRYP